MNELDKMGEYSLADENVLDVQTITDAVMSTSQSLTELGIRFFMNLFICWLIIYFFYYKKSRRRDYFFTFMVFSSAMLLLLYMMGNVEVGIGLTLGLFAIFGVIRYRTETVPIREMTYLFVIIAISAVNGLAPVFQLVGAASATPHYELEWGSVGLTFISNLLMVGLIGIFENDKLIRHSSTKLVLYDRIELIVPEKRQELIADLEKRIGLKIDSVEVGHVDFLRDAAFVKIHYRLDSGEINSIDQLTKAKDYVV